MNKFSILLILLLCSVSILSQTLLKPIGCFAGTNGINPAVLSHEETRGVLLVGKWSEIETTPGVFDFSILDSKIELVKEAGLKYSLAIAGGAFGSPSWLIDSLDVDYHSFVYQNQDWRLPLWWDSVCSERLNDMIEVLGNEYATDSMLSHIYVTQMTTNGIEGHLNGVNMSAIINDGYTNEKWIEVAKTTTLSFAAAFPNIPIVFEIHEIDQDIMVPSRIIDELSNEPILCERLGLGMWWISGKSTYQSDLINYIHDFDGDKYAQVIGRSDQEYRFKDSLYSTVFTQAKELGIRYIEPWPYEFQFNTNDSLFVDFNMWADENFNSIDTCDNLLSLDDLEFDALNILIYPNPSQGHFSLELNQPVHINGIVIFNSNRQKIREITGKSEIDISSLESGIYLIKIKYGTKQITKKIIKID